MVVWISGLWGHLPAALSKWLVTDLWLLCLRNNERFFYDCDWALQQHMPVSHKRETGARCDSTGVHASTTTLGLRDWKGQDRSTKAVEFTQTA